MKISLLLTLILTSFQVFAAEPAVGVKNFRSLYYSLAAVTGVRPTPEMNAYYKSVMTRLPKDGKLEEVLSPSSLMAVKGVASLFCKQFSANNPNLAKLDDQALLNDLSQRIYGRTLTTNETKIQMNLINGAQDKAFVACTSMASSEEFLLQ